jgi:hypothetical protein
MAKKMVKFGLLMDHNENNNLYVFNIMVLEEYDNTYKIEYGKKILGEEIIINPPKIVDKNKITKIEERELTSFEFFLYKYIKFNF